MKIWSYIEIILIVGIYPLIIGILLYKYIKCKRKYRQLITRMIKKVRSSKTINKTSVS